jgi:uncharacterized protein
MNPKNNCNPLETALEADFPTMDTVSKTVINLKNPTEDSLKIEDIASGLSLICRFGGQIPRFYSVAQHSLLVSALAPKELKREALLHDASEAFLGDVIKPLKALIGKAYSEIEDRFQTVIFNRFGADINKLKDVKEFDLKAYWLEDRALRQGKPMMLQATMTDNDMILAGSTMYYQPIVAKMEFLRAFGILFNDRSKMEA